MIRSLLINIVVVVSLFSQDSSSINIGFKGGLNFSYISGAHYDYSGNLNDNNFKFGFNFGVILDKKTKNPTSFQLELIYNKTGSKWGQPLIGFGYDGDYVIYELQYLTISTYFKLKSRIGNLFKDFDFALGVSYSYNISATQNWVLENSDFEGPSNIRDELNKHEIGIVYGVKFPFKNRNYYLNFMFYHALTTLYPDSYIGYMGDFGKKNQMRNNTFSISFDAFLFD